MRCKDWLLELGDIGKLLQYLYMDESHYILVDNQLTVLKVTMDDNADLWSLNMHYPDIPKMRYDPSVNTLLAIIDQLKQSKPQISSFSSAWEEIVVTASVTTCLNDRK